MNASNWPSPEAFSSYASPLISNFTCAIGFEAVRRGDHITQQPDMLLHGIMLQHVGHDIRQVLLRHQLFLVAQLNDTFRHFAGLLGRQFQTNSSKFLRILAFLLFLPKALLSLTAETFGQKVVAIKVGLVVPVGMHTGHLRKHTLARNRTVGRNRDAGIAFHHPAHFVQPALVDACLCIELVFSISPAHWPTGHSCPFAQAVDRGMDTQATAQHGSQHVGNGQVVIVMGMEVEMHARIAFHHLADVTQQINGFRMPTYPAT